MPVLEPLKATQISAKLAHACQRVRTIELEVRNGLQTGPNAHYATPIGAGTELCDVIRYLSDVQGELLEAIRARAHF